MSETLSAPGLPTPSPSSGTTTETASELNVSSRYPHLQTVAHVSRNSARWMNSGGKTVDSKIVYNPDDDIFHLVTDVNAFKKKFKNAYEVVSVSSLSDSETDLTPLFL